MHNTYVTSLIAALATLDMGALGACDDQLEDCYLWRRRLILFGNGGSASTASHAVCDLQKNLYLKTQKSFEVIALTDSPSMITAWSNDTSYKNVFAAQLKNWVRPKDLVIAISGSGNSPNIIEAVVTAKLMDATVIGLTGMGGGELAKIADYPLVVKSDSMQIVEDVHLAVCHMMFLNLLEKAEDLYL